MEKNVIRLSKYARNVGVVGTALFFLVTVIAAVAGEPIPGALLFLDCNTMCLSDHCLQ